MNDRLRSVLLGLMAGFVPLLLLDLARILYEAHLGEPGRTSQWWSIACYLAVGMVTWWVVSVGWRDRWVPTVGAVIIALFVLPTLPVRAIEWLPDLPLAPANLTQRSIAIVLIGAFILTAMSGAAGRRRQR